MNARRRRRNAPHSSEHSAAMDSHRARRERRLVSRACSATGVRYSKTRGNTRAVAVLNGALYQIGEDIERELERARRIQRNTDVPSANTSFGQHVEWVLKPSVGEEMRGELLRLAMRVHSREAVEAISSGRVKTGIRLLVGILAG